ncbi:hypothetical protein D3C72_1437090 [compost metagenome]
MFHVVHREGHMVDRAFAVDRRTLMPVRLMQELNNRARAAGVRLEAVVGSRLAYAPETDRFAHEADRFGDFPQRQRDAVHAADGMDFGNIAGHACRTRVEIRFDKIELDATRMLEALAALSEALDDLAVIRHVHGIEAAAPELERARGDRVVDDPHLARSLTRHDPPLAERERRHQGPRIAIRVAVVKVVDGILAVEKHGLLHEALPEQLDVEVHILLRVPHAGGQVMKSLQH